MKLILDTHIAIWFITDDEKLGPETKALIEDADNVIFLSLVSLWEIGIKYSLGKLELKTDLNCLFELFSESGFRFLPIMPEHILTNATLSFHHKDPFDRLIIAQAKREGYSLISADELFERYQINLIKA